MSEQPRQMYINSLLRLCYLWPRSRATRRPLRCICVDLCWLWCGMRASGVCVQGCRSGICDHVYMFSLFPFYFVMRHKNLRFVLTCTIYETLRANIVDVSDGWFYCLTRPKRRGKWMRNKKQIGAKLYKYFTISCWTIFILCLICKHFSQQILHLSIRARSYSLRCF